ncbi:hypothetical protein R3P38DRAFT_2774377 [Favolaschia claudopus]|uniref:Uncharacterized protein n=1 Tax=Favolaschia claudopus TaxID=2862362 RepID=A0AAW0BYC6_9AGAR
MVFDAEAMAKIHAGLAAVRIPSWIDRPPTNLGEKAHGKLKADNWLVLITIFFPLILPEMWYEGELDLTMLRQICRRGKLYASANDSIKFGDPESPTVKALHILYGEDSISNSTSNNGERLSPMQETAHNGSGPILEASTYDMILSYWNQTYSPTYIHKSQLTYDLMNAGVKVLPTHAVELTHFKHKTRLFSIFRKNTGSSSISFRHPATGRKDFVYIQEVWKQALQGEYRIFVIIQPHTTL